MQLMQTLQKLQLGSLHRIRRMPSLLTFLFFIVVNSGAAFSETKAYRLVIDNTVVNFSGTPVNTLSVNHDIPGPTLEFIEGQTARIEVENRLDVETSIHWHGILLPNSEDGVSHVTTPPILPHSTHVFKFPIKQSGTYWYHSHTGLQEQRGVYGAIVIYPRDYNPKADREYTVLLSDWSNENPQEILRTLKRGSSYYSFRKGSLPNWIEALRTGNLKSELSNEWGNMPPMDLSDVAYDAFLANGQKQLRLPAKPGETVKIRLVNGSAATYFYLQLANQPMKIIAADGVDVEPFEVNRTLMAIAETYDFVFKMPNEKQTIEFRATAQDVSGYTSVLIGDGPTTAAPDVVRQKLFMSHSQHMNHHEGHHMMMSDKEHPATPYNKLKSKTATTLDSGRPWREYKFVLDGDMERYLWTMNGKTLSESDSILVKKGENVRFYLTNNSMMHHPMHLHGHFFRVINKTGEYAPLKHTVDVPPFSTRVIEFAATEEKDWLFHCHVLYHMVSGMHQIVHYIDGSDEKHLNHAPSHMKEHNPWFVWGDAGVSSNFLSGHLQGSNERNDLTFDWETGWDGGPYELTPLYSRYINPNLKLFAGADIEDSKSRAIAGTQYRLPFLLETRVWVDNSGDFRFTMSRDIQFTARSMLFNEVEYNTDGNWKFRYGIDITLDKNASFVTEWHSDYGVGAGVKFKF